MPEPGACPALRHPFRRRPWPGLIAPRGTTPTVNGMGQLLWGGEIEALVGKRDSSERHAERNLAGRHHRAAQPVPKNWIECGLEPLGRRGISADKDVLNFGAISEH
jgi:hypothetical protein